MTIPVYTQGVNDDLIGTVIDGRFDILERLTAGGMGVVYRARHVLLDAVSENMTGVNTSGSWW